MTTPITPQELAALIRRLARDEGGGLSVSLPALLDALTMENPLPEGPAGWRAQVALRQAIRTAVGQIPDMRFIEGDS
jgi:hypothetical protein